MDYINKYANIQSIIHRWDPRAKVIAFVILVVFIVLTRPESFAAFAFYGILIFALILMSKIPIKYVIKRSITIIPFVLFIAIFIPFLKEGRALWSYPVGKMNIKVTYEGLMMFWNVMVKAYLSALCMILLSASTGFFQLLKALEGLKIPGIIVMVFSFMHRYFFILQDELMMMRRAKESRSVNGRRWLHTRALANMLGVLFIKSYERGEAVYLAMCSRGFDGSIRTMEHSRLTNRDVCFTLVIVVLLVSSKFLEFLT